MTLDVMMPDLDGFDVIQVLRNDPITRDLPVLFVSAVPEPERGAALGGSGFLLKPFAPRSAARTGSTRRSVCRCCACWSSRTTTMCGLCWRA